MTKLADITWETTQSGVSHTQTGTSCISATETGTVGSLADSTKRLRTQYVHGSGTAAWVAIDLATVASVGSARSVGGYMRWATNPATMPPGETLQLITVMANSDGTFVAQVAVNTSGNLIVRYNNNGTITSVTASSNSLLTNADNTFHFFVDVSTTASSRALLLVNGSAVVDQTFSTSTGVTLGSGLSHIRLGQYTANTAASQFLMVWDGQTIGNAATAETSIEAGASSTITGNTSPIAASTRTLDLDTTAGTPAWTSDDTDVMTVDSSTGVVTLQQAAGGIATIADGGTDSVEVEFLPRTVVYSVSTLNDLGSAFSVDIVLSSVSDGHTTYPDIFPAVGGLADCALTGITGSNPTWTATFAKTGAGPFVILVNGNQIQPAAALTGAAIAQATATGTLITAIPLEGSAVAISVAGGNLVTTIQLAGAAIASAQATGALTAEIRLSGAAVAEALAAGSLTTGGSGLEGTAGGQASASGALTTEIPLIGAAIAQATASGGLGSPVPLEGVAAAVSSATGELTVSISLSGAAAAQAAASATLTTTIVLAGAALVQAAASGALAGAVRTWLPIHVLAVPAEDRILLVRI